MRMLCLSFAVAICGMSLTIALPNLHAAVPQSSQTPIQRDLNTDEPSGLKFKPEGVPDYVAKPSPSDGRHLALTMQKLQKGIHPARPFVIWALGSSYCNMLGNGEFWQQEIPKLFANAPPIEYRKMVGNSCPWQYLRGWARHLVVPDQPDLVLIYTIGKPEELEKLIIELRTHTTADIIVPTIHWRERDVDLWGKSENAVDQDVAAVREVCRKHDVEFVENRQDWGAYLRVNDLPVTALLKDAVHQSEYGALIINRNLLSHLRKPDVFSYNPSAREHRVRPQQAANGSFRVSFVGNRIDLHGVRSPDGGRFQVLVDGKPAAEIDAFLVGYIQPGKDNSRERFGNSPTVPRDSSPHGITLGNNITPQDWTIVMTSDRGDYELIGSRTGADGKGNAFERFTSLSGQIVVDPELWRRAERNRTGDSFTFTITRSVVPEVTFQGTEGESFIVRVAQVLTNREHTLDLVPIDQPEARIEAFEVFQPPYHAN